MTVIPPPFGPRPPARPAVRPTVAAAAAEFDPLLEAVKLAADLPAARVYGAAPVAAPARPRRVVETVGGVVPYGPAFEMSYRGRPTLVAWAAGCFAAAVRLAAARPVRLLVEHDPARELAGTADGSLVLWDTPAGLHWACDPGTVRGAAAAAFVRAAPPRAVSVGARPAVSVPRGAGGLLVVAADLDELTLTADPAQPGTGVRAGRFALPA